MAPETHLTAADVSVETRRTAGMAIAVCKASLVVLFFMHVLVSPRLTWVVIAVACFWLAILFMLTMNDYFSRGMLPYTPGH